MVRGKNQRKERKQKIMAKLTRLQRSQKAHDRLKTKHIYTPGVKGDILIRYHNNILNIQKAKKRVLTKNERRKVFATVRKRVYNR